MADLVELYGRAVAQFGRHLPALGDRWRAPTPDSEWDVRALVNHVLRENLWAPPLLDGLTIADVGDRFAGDQLGHDPEQAWDAAAASSIVAVGADGALDRTVHVSFGDIPGRAYISQLVCDT
ncbi:MAG: maleylpyruvate isomerase N-terminal domain-containing protein [Acidimicrobiales bacterium]